MGIYRIQKYRIKMGESRGFFDLRKQFVFYASYHNQPVNVFIHLVCIWNLLWSGMCLMHFTPQVAASPDILNKVPLVGGTPINLTLLVTSIYVVTYVMMDPIAGSLAATLVLLLHRFAFNVVMWIVQFIGHGVFEGRAPALLESWDQAFITAPLFVILEVLFFFGYRKQFYQDCMKEVEVEIKKFRAIKNK